MTDEDFLARIRRLQQASQNLAAAKAKTANAAKKKAADAKHHPNMVVGIRIDPTRITLPKLRFMGEVPVHQHLLQDDREA